MTYQPNPNAPTAARIEELVGFPVYLTLEDRGMLIAVQPDGCYGPGGAEGDLALAERVAAAVEGSYVVACGVVAYDY